MQTHVVILMKDGEVIRDLRPDSIAGALAAVAECLAEIRRLPGLYRLTAEGPAVNLRANVDLPSAIPGPASPPPRSNSAGRSFAQRHHRPR